MFNQHDECLTYLEQVRWSGVPTCPYCGSTNATTYKKERRYHCNNCFTSFSVTVGTFFHKTHIDLQKWFLAIRLVIQSPEQISVRQLAREIGVSKNTAMYMLRRIRSEMDEPSGLLNRILINHKYFCK
jgi:transposase-like protein